MLHEFHKLLTILIFAKCIKLRVYYKNMLKNNKIWMKNKLAQQKTIKK